MQSRENQVSIGVIGCGGFGLFALQHFLQVPGVELRGVALTHQPASLAAARRFGVENTDDLDEFLGRREIDLVYIATPPFLHHQQAMAALRAGKHVICEKPLAVSLEQADEMIALARRRDLLLTANLMQRYNPLFDAVSRLIDEKLLGEVLHGYFENYAADEGLPAEHWFWDRDKSGGIFVEHGVHFFDLLAGWLGEGQVVAAQAARRPDSGVEEQVHCTARYPRPGGEVLFNFYHGFHQPGRLDRQELRLVCERGDITLHEWIPSRFRLHAVADEATTRALCDAFPGARLDVTAIYAGKERAARGRGRELDAWQTIELSGGWERPKMHRYGDLLRGLLADQLAWIADRDHQRKLTEVNGRSSLAMALAARSLAAPSLAAPSLAAPSLAEA
jgi:predicted dehydrogenase